MATPKSAKTVGECLDYYLAIQKRLGKKTVNQMHTALRFMKSEYGGLEPLQITPPLMRDYLLKRKAGELGDRPVSDRAASLELAYLRAALRLAQHDGKIALAPRIILPRNAGVRRRKRFLSVGEAKKLMVAVKDPATAFHIRVFVELALLTAQRGVAIRELKWEHVDFEAGVIWFSKTDPNPANNKKRPDMPLTPPLLRALMPARAVAKTDWVIEYRERPVKSVKTGFAAVVRRAGLKGVGIHDLRRTVATLLLHGGADVREVAMMLGDDERIVRAHYAHVTPKLLEATVMKASAHLE